MAKTTVTSLVTKIKRRIDYDIADTDLQNLLVDIINDCLKQIHQWFIDYEIFEEIGKSTTIAATANQAYIDISTTLASMDEIISLSERTNDTTIQRISYEDFKDFYPDPTAYSSTTPKHFAIWDQKIYLGPTPSAALTIYVDYTGIPTEVTMTDTLPYKNKFDPLLIAMCMEWWCRWYDKSDRASINTAAENSEKLLMVLIVAAAKNIGKTHQVRSRNEGWEIDPRIPDNGGGYGYGVGGYGGGGYGGT